jgi:PPOX class probable FMN-dependent enzyme
LTIKHQITTEEELRALIGEPAHELIMAKSTPALTPPLQKYISLSPFVCIATHNEDGSSDVSPRGDQPGFVHIRDERTLIIPERPGNRRLDSVTNIIRQPRLALLFMIPGVLETLRVNGTGVISADPELLELFPVNGKLPRIVIVVTVEEALGHCSKAFRRSKLWEADYRPGERVPTLAEMMSGHLALDQDMMTLLDAAIEDDAVNNMY